MSAQLSLTLFAHVCGRPDDELDLGEAALLLAEIDAPDVDQGVDQGVDLPHARALLDGLGEGARAAIARAEAEAGRTLRVEESIARRVEALARFLHDEAGFHGNDEDYYDPKNSFLDEVLARRTGIPISLAVVLIEVGRRAGVTLEGVSFPGHFLVRAVTPAGLLLVDPFSGKILDRGELRAFYARATGDDRDPPARLLEPAGKRLILLRMLANLRGIYSARGGEAHLRAVLERMQVLAPSAELGREIARLGGSTPFRSAGRALN
ncbi:MAG: transglutaminase-like domain-containing protein [Minicystis sp.]